MVLNMNDVLCLEVKSYCGDWETYESSWCRVDFRSQRLFYLQISPCEDDSSFEFETLYYIWEADISLQEIGLDGTNLSETDVLKAVTEYSFIPKSSSQFLNRSEMIEKLTTYLTPEQQSFMFNDEN